jgi:hypothetical protein
MKSCLFQPPVVVIMPLELLKVTVKALYKKLKKYDGVVTTHILKKAFEWFRASDKESWLKVYCDLLDRDEKLDKDIVKIKHTKFVLLLKILNKKDIFKTTESEICYGDYECKLSYRGMNRRGDLTHTLVGSIGYCTWKCRFYFQHLNNYNKIYYNSAKEMVQVIINCSKKAG